MRKIKRRAAHQEKGKKRGEKKIRGRQKGGHLIPFPTTCLHTVASSNLDRDHHPSLGHPVNHPFPGPTTSSLLLTPPLHLRLRQCSQSCCLRSPSPSSQSETFGLTRNFSGTVLTNIQRMTNLPCV